jgi:WD40-like Beta Propeller Repeat
MKKIMSFLLLCIFANASQAQPTAKTKASTKPVAADKNSNATTAIGTLLYGKLGAPSGTNLTVQYNGKNDLVLSAPKKSGEMFSNTSFNFATPLKDSTKYTITLKNIPSGKTANVYAGGAGTMPQNANTIRVGCDFTYDLISRSSNDATLSTFYESADADISGATAEDGRYVVFVSSSAGFAGWPVKHRQIFLRDRNTGTTKLISAALDGEEGNGDSFAPAIAANGTAVAFESYSSNLVTNDKNGVRDIFVWVAATNKIETVSIGEGGKEANAESYEPSISGDGKMLAFTSTASNISLTAKGISNNNVFLRDLQKGSTVMISVDPLTRKGGGGSKPSISYDGSRIAFYSHTSTLVSNDNNGIWDIFLWDKNNLQLKRVSLTADGKEREQGNESANRIVSPAISGNGRYIAFATTASNIVASDNNNFQDVFVYDVNTNTTIIASNTNNNKPSNGDSPIGQGEKIAISFDGSWVAFSTNATNLEVPAANIVMHNISTLQNHAVSTLVGSSVGRPAMSPASGYVIFGIGGKLDSRFTSSGIFANYTGVGPCRLCPQ